MASRETVTRSMRWAISSAARSGRVLAMSRSASRPDYADHGTQRCGSFVAVEGGHGAAEHLSEESTALLDAVRGLLCRLRHQGSYHARYLVDGSHQRTPATTVMLNGWSPSRSAV